MRHLTLALTAALLFISAYAGDPYAGDPESRVAIVVGVNKPAGLATGLKGCESDARAMAVVLEKKGYQVTTLLAAQATDGAVLATLRSLPPAANMLFYFAGYGTGPQQPRLLTADCRQSPTGLVGGIPITILDAALLARQDQAKTVVLDTAFSPSARPSQELTGRYFGAAGSRDVAVLVDGVALPGITQESIQYITAGRYNEEAVEGRFGEENRGVFSYYLTRELDKSTQRNLPVSVSAQVIEGANDRQHPSFPQQFHGFGGPPAAAAPSPTSEESSGSDFMAMLGAERKGPQHYQADLWTTYVLDNRRPEKVTLTMVPNRSPVKVGEFLSFQATVGTDGYLLLVEHSVEGQLALVYPRNGQTESARVKAGQTVLLPAAGEKVFAATPGRERLKAFLIPEAASAQSMTLSFHEKSGTQFDQAPQLLGSRSVDFVCSETSTQRVQAPIFYTADLHFEVVR